MIMGDGAREFGNSASFTVMTESAGNEKAPGLLGPPFISLLESHGDSLGDEHQPTLVISWSERVWKGKRLTARGSQGRGTVSSPGGGTRYLNSVCLPIRLAWEMRVGVANGPNGHNG
jgi:hypothetical protein